MSLSTTEGRLYLVELDNFERLEIQFVPKNLQRSRGSGTQSVEVVGQNTPIYFQGAGEDTLRFQLDFYSEDDNRRDVMEKCRWLEALTYTETSKDDATQVQLVYGKMFRGERWLVEGIRIQYENFHKRRGFLPQQAYVDLVLVRAEKNIRKNDIR